MRFYRALLQHGQREAACDEGYERSDNHHGEPSSQTQSSDKPPIDYRTSAPVPASVTERVERNPPNRRRLFRPRTSRSYSVSS